MSKLKFMVGDKVETSAGKPGIIVRCGDGDYLVEMSGKPYWFDSSELELIERTESLL